MNRRGFFRKAFGLVAGILAATVAPVKPKAYTYGGGKVYGYTNFPTRNRAVALPVYGPWQMYMPKLWDKYLDGSFQEPTT